MQDTCLEMLQAGVELAVDSAAVVALRLGRIARSGPDTNEEIEKMITEKIDANLALLPIILRPRDPADPMDLSREIIEYYHNKVRENRKRLTAKG